MNPIAFTIAVAASALPAVSAAVANAGPLLAQPAAASIDALTPIAVSYKDGNFTGPAVSAYYGDVQVQVVVQNGQITTLNVVKYPFDRRESLRISQQSLPLLRNEVVKAQNARVNIVTGATLTSQAFMRSLDAALTQAGGTPSLPPAAPAAPNRGGFGGQVGI